MADGHLYDPRDLPERLRRRLDSYIRNVCGRWLGNRGINFVEDCRVEVELLLWFIQDKWQALPQEEQERYILTCVGHRLSELMQRERQSRKEEPLSEDLHLTGDASEDLAGQAGRVENQIFADKWPAGIQNPELAEALSRLSPQQFRLLELHYRQELTNVEIAERLNLSEDAVKMRRNRALDRLRHLLRPGDAAGARCRPLEDFRKLLPPARYLSWLRGAYSIIGGQRPD